MVERLAKDLRAEFPEIEGFSPRNLKYMTSVRACEIGPQVIKRCDLSVKLGRNTIEAMDEGMAPTEKKIYRSPAVAVETFWVRTRKSGK